jgi:hypothetical protein
MSAGSKLIPEEKTCVLNMKALIMALNNYHDQYTIFPFQESLENFDTWNNNWRLRIEQFFREKNSKQAYWNPSFQPPLLIDNQYVAPFFFTCPLDHNSSKSKGTTSYLLLIHDQKYTSLPNEAVIIVESAQSGIHWNSPENTTINELKFAYSPFGYRKLNSLHKKNGVRCIRKDFKIISISYNTDREIVIKILQGRYKPYWIPIVVLIIILVVVIVTALFVIIRRSYSNNQRACHVSLICSRIIDVIIGFVIFFVGYYKK